MYMMNIINIAEVNYGICVKCYYVFKDHRKYRKTNDTENLGDVKIIN